jgi:hypothetical protein
MPVREIPSLLITLSTTLRTSARHHLPDGFLVAQAHAPSFFSFIIRSSMVDLRCFLTSASISETV